MNRGAFGLGDGLDVEKEARRRIAELAMQQARMAQRTMQKPRYEGIIDLTQVNGVWMKPDEA